MGEWVDAATWRSLQAVFGRFEAGDAWRALLANLELFRRLATETAQRFGYVYPALLDERVTQLVNELHAGDTVFGRSALEKSSGYTETRDWLA